MILDQLKVAVCGTINGYSPSQITQIIHDLGGRAARVINGTTSALLVDDDWNSHKQPSTKLMQALKAGVPVIRWSALLRLRKANASRKVLLEDAVEWGKILRAKYEIDVCVEPEVAEAEPSMAQKRAAAEQRIAERRRQRSRAINEQLSVLASGSGQSGAVFRF